MAGPGGLLSRGLLEDHATSYGALPQTKQKRATLAASLSDYVRARFPEYAESYSGAGVVGVPGFWQELSGVVEVPVINQFDNRSRIAAFLDGLLHAHVGISISNI